MATYQVAVVTGADKEMTWWLAILHKFNFQSKLIYTTGSQGCKPISFFLEKHT